MKDYSDIGLDRTLKSINSLANRRKKYTNATDFDANIEIPIGKINYAHVTGASKVYTAVVSLSKEQGTFDKIQDAIEHVNKLGGGVVFIKKGTYVLSDDLTVYSNITILGQDNDTTILDFNNTAKNIDVKGTSGAHLNNVHIKDIQVKNSTDTEGGIDFTYVDDFSVVNCKFTNNGTGDVGADFCTVGRIIGNVANLSERFFKGFTSTEISVKDNKITQFEDRGILVDSGSNIYISGNTITKTSGTAQADGIRIFESNKTRIIGNHISILNGQGVAIQHASETTVVGNILISTQLSAVSIEENSDDNTIQGNIVKGGQVDGVGVIGIGDGDNNVITGNIAQGGSIGVDIGTDSDRNLIVSNHLSRPTTTINDTGTNTIAANNITA